MQTVSIFEPVSCAGEAFETEIGTYIDKPSAAADNNAWLVPGMELGEPQLGDSIAK